MNVENFFPYNQMTIESDTTIGYCVRIPKIYVKNSVDENGLITREISQTLQEGYHCHPAFMHNETERDAILIACDIVNGNEVSFDTAKSQISGISGTEQTSTGSTYGTWKTLPKNSNNEIHMYNIFEHHLIALLMLIEYETTDIKTAMDLEQTATNANWRGITQHWGDINLWCDGLTGEGIIAPENHPVQIFDNQGNFTLQNTLQNGIAKGYIKTVSNENGTNWNLSDIFIANQTTQEKTEGSFGTQQSSGGFPQIEPKIKISSKTKDCNPFYLEVQTSIETANYRLAKFADNGE